MEFLNSQLFMWRATKINLSLINVNDLSQDMNLELYLDVDVLRPF